MATTPIFKSADPLFNAKAAQAAYELVMKMDEDSARTFAEIVVADVTEEIIEKNLRTVQTHLDAVVAKRIALVKKTVVAKSLGNPDAVPFAQALALIEKAKNPYDYGYVWNEKDFNRDLTTGRFRSKVSHTQKKPVKPDVQNALGIPTHPRHDKLKPAQQAKYQDEYRQLAAFLSSVHESTRTPGDAKVALHFEDKAGNRSVKTIDGTHATPDMLEPDGADLVGIEAKPGALTVGGASFGLTHALGRRGVESTNAAADGMPDFAASWASAPSGRNSNERTYSRIGAGAKFLGQVAPNSTHAQMAAAFGEFVGSMGPEAERVIGPTARKTAYRYRGTERTPDKALVAAYASGIRHAKSQSTGDPYRNTPEGRKANLKSPQDLAPSQMARARAENDKRAPSWEERDTGRAVIQTYFANKVKDGSQLYGLQLASGNTPPSEGVMLNKDGQIVTQAVGYGDDHYLPFDLKNMKALKGGEYIRSRSVGGLTSEDIYAGLITGARQVTVVSRSGTFTLTFEEDLKGGRRHNDKARRMTRRYEQILDAVQSEQVDKPGNINPEIKRLLIEEVETELGEYGNPRDKRDLLKKKIEDYKSEPELTEVDEKLITIMAQRKRADGVSPDAKDYVRQVTGEILADKHLRYRLDGHGYSSALKALEEQFPYYIKVNSRITDEQDVSNTNLDLGYVEPDRNRPTAAKAGLYGTATRMPGWGNPGQKFSASQADYQGAFNPTSRPGSTPPPAAAPAGAGGTQTATKFDATKFKILPKSEPRVSNDFAPAAVELQEAISTKVRVESMTPEQKEAMSYTAADLTNPGKQANFDRLVQTVKTQVTLPDASLTRYNEAKGNYGLRPYNEQLRGAWSNVPFAFEGPAFVGGASVEAKRAELDKIDQRVPSSILSPKKLSQMSESELQREYEALTKVYTRLDAAGSPKDPTKAARVLMEMGADKTAPGLKALVAADDKEAKAGAFLDDVHRARAVIQGMRPEDRVPKEKQVLHTGDGVAPESGVPVILQSLEQAASFLEKTSTKPKDQERATAFRELASTIRQEQGAILGTSSVDALIDSNRAVFTDLQEVMHQRRGISGSA